MTRGITSVLDLLQEDIKNYTDQPRAQLVFEGVYRSHLEMLPEGRERKYYASWLEHYHHQQQVERSS